ncbi:DUF427 domain-containing protein [Kribbella deserti]|uniref:DUF427 domain-containing protein n=1 Tax=Kribbella deserti TaxID=1926257 RepID=A0ABV6QLY8_9ACTN
MALLITDEYRRSLGELRFHPTPKRVRARKNGETLVDSEQARIVWEPRRVVGQYAVPVADIAADLTEAPAPAAAEHPVRMIDSPVLDPSSAFAVHTCPGSTFDVGPCQAAGFVPDDPDLDGYVLLDWAAFDEWLEEDEPIVGHPRDPRSRIDLLASSRHVRVELDGVELANSVRPLLLVETFLPPRYYLRPEDVRMELLQPSDLRTTCAYKGHAAYWSLGTTAPNIAWAYPEPLDGMQRLAGLVSFFTEQVDLEVDGVRLERPLTPWSSN